MCKRGLWGLTLTGWHGEEAGTGPAHSSDRVRPPSPILMSRGGSAAGPPGGGTPSGSVGRRREGAEVRHSANQGGRWAKNVVFLFVVLFFKENTDKKKKTQHKTSSRTQAGNCIVLYFL